VVLGEGLNPTLVSRKQIEKLGQAGYYFGLIDLISSKVFRLLAGLNLVVF
jgi:hypothetical protein